MLINVVKISNATGWVVAIRDENKLVISRKVYDLQCTDTVVGSMVNDNMVMFEYRLPDRRAFITTLDDVLSGFTELIVIGGK